MIYMANIPISTVNAPILGASPTTNTMVVKSGDTLGNIAAANKTTVEDIKLANPVITDINKIQAGQVIKMPAPKIQAIPVPTVLATPPATIAPTAPPPAALSAVKTPAVSLTPPPTALAQPTPVKLETPQAIKPVAEIPAALAPKEMPTAVLGVSTATPNAPSVGTLSAKYESSGNPGTISTGANDPGGKSYGTYQLSSKTGSLLAFMNSLKTTNPTYYAKLNTAYTTGGVGFGPNFDAAWKQIATDDPAGFGNLQHSYIQQTYYVPATTQLMNKYGFDVSKHSVAVQNMIWSMAVQHGLAGQANILNKVDLKADDATIINQAYAARTAYVNGLSTLNASMKAGIANRYVQEKTDALKMLADYPTATEAATEVTPPTTPTVPTTPPPPATNIISTRNLPKLATANQGDVQLAQELQSRNIPYQWDAETGTITINGQKLMNADVPGASMVGDKVYVPPNVLNTIVQKYGTAGTATPVLQRDGSTQTYIDEKTGKPWIIDNYKNDYQVEIERIQRINPSDPRVDMLEKARAATILANPSQYPNLVDWANDIQSGQWQAKNYESNYQAEINRLRAINPADPRIDKLEHLRAAKILSMPSVYDKNTLDWAASVDSRGWNVDDYSQNYMAEINRIAAFNTRDPRIAQLEAARAETINANPLAFPQEDRDWAEGYVTSRGEQIAQEKIGRQYKQQEIAADIATQQAVRTIMNYYKQQGLAAGGQAASDVRQAAVQGLAGQQALQQQELEAKTALSQQQIQARATKAAEQETLAASREQIAANKYLQEQQNVLAKAQLDYQLAKLAYDKSQIGVTK